MLRSFLNSIIKARQSTANAKIADILQRTEYKTHTYAEVLEAVKNQDLEMLRR